MRLSTEQIEFKEAIRSFCNKRCSGHQQRADLTDSGTNPHNSALYKEIAELGWVGVNIPVEFGGSGGDTIDQVLLFEEIAYGMLPVSALGPSSTVAGFYKRSASEEQKRNALQSISNGDVWSISISEPEAGSDVANVSCRASPVDGGYVLNGQKTWCSAAHHADKILVIARTSRGESRHHGLTMFEVDAGGEGVAVHPIPTMAGREVNDVFLNDVFVPHERVVGEPDYAWAQVMGGLDGERMLGAGQSLGIARRSLDDALKFASERKQFGATIGTFQAVRHRLADLAIEVECAQVFLYDVAARKAEGSLPRAETARLTSMAKVKLSETAKRAALEGMQVMGGYGYADEYDMERQVRSALVQPIFAGTNEVQREVIGKSLGLV